MYTQGEYLLYATCIRKSGEALVVEKFQIR
jgi:hypothetical protein